VESGWIKWFPELVALIGCDQHPDWHSEGDVYTHTKMVVDSAAWARDKVDPEWMEAFVFGAFLHDVGKPATTVFPHLVESGEFPEDRLWTARGHDHAGVAPATAFMERLTNDKKLIERTTIIVREHMQPYNLSNGEAKESAWKRLHNKVRLDIIGWMSRCDSCGTGCNRQSIGDPDLEHEYSKNCWDRYSDLGGPEPIKPLLMGRHLIAAGHKPGPTFKKMLDAAYEAQIDNPDLDEAELLTVATAV
jgi:tRNA nucleotidyltransferase (CCA-adding enzyme)